IVSDGCSNARRLPTDPVLTDIGSRLLALSAIPYLFHDHFDDASFCHTVLAEANTHLRGLRLNINALSATLLTATLDNEVIKTRVIGDGNIVARKRETGELEVFEIVFLAGGIRAKAAPYYLRYELEPEIKKGWIEQFGGAYQINKYTISLNGNINKTQQQGQVTAEEVFCLTNSFPLAEYDMVALLSDGLNAFTRCINEETRQQVLVPTCDVVREFFAYKRNYKGEFVKRRCKKAFDVIKKQNWQNTDDFSKGVIIAL
ncbi:MAG: hypothetical protein GQ569_02155, partial [Methylococcaceae bacterium]|nr:hypothetical protein [Methylococcaceae bacterium]